MTTFLKIGPRIVNMALVEYIWFDPHSLTVEIDFDIADKFCVAFKGADGRAFREWWAHQGYEESEER